MDTTPTVYTDVAYPFIATGDNFQTGANSYGFSSGFSVYFRLAGSSTLLFLLSPALREEKLILCLVLFEQAELDF
jgi:hypothetical protein